MGGPDHLQAIITLRRLRRDEPLRNNIYAFNASRTKRFPYQFKPLLKLLDSPTNRLLIADEVGLGKTIEAGLILTELRARQTLRTVLVVCPANLTQKWRMELNRRFGENFQVMSSGDIRAFLDEVARAPDPSRVMLNGIISLEAFRRKDVVALFEAVAPRLELVIVDEAHHLRNLGTLSRRAGQALSDNADTMLMLTATPIQLGTVNLFSLLNVLDPEDFPDRQTAERRFRDNEPLVSAHRLSGRLNPDYDGIKTALRTAQRSPWLANDPRVDSILERVKEIEGLVLGSREARQAQVQLHQHIGDLNLLGAIFSRTRRREVQQRMSQRRSYAVTVKFSEAEASFYKTVTELIMYQSALRGDHPIISIWRLNTPQRRMASSIQAMVDFYREHIDEAFLGQDQGEDEDYAEADAEGTDSSARSHPMVVDARQRLNHIISTWPDNIPDSKYTCFRDDILSRLWAETPERKVMVFAFFKDTLRYIGRQLEREGIRCHFITGDTPPADRLKVIDQFREDPGAKVLLSSRVGSEGLDFQFCSALVNYDLPWNPMDVEQRIGRLDRIGQESPTIDIFNLWVEDSIENRILRRLYERLRIFERAIGDLEAVLGEQVSDLERVAFDQSLTEVEREQEAEHIATTIARQVQAAEQLEAESARLVGADELIAEEIERIIQGRQYVTGEQLHGLLEQFLELHAPRTRLVYDGKKSRGRLFPDQVLRSFLQSRGRAAEAINLLRGGKDGVAITFESDVAFEDPRIEFINVLHPLMHAVAEHYMEQGGLLPASQVALATRLLRPGAYLVFVYEVRVTGVKERRILQVVVLDDTLSEVLSAEEAEALLGELVERGRHSAKLGDGLNRTMVERSCRGAERLLMDRIEVLRQDLTKMNAAYLERRVASLRSHFGKQIARHERQEQQLSDERIRLLHRSAAENRRAELEDRINHLAPLGRVEVAYDEVAAVLVDVIPA